MKFTRRGLFGTLFASAVAAPAVVAAAKSVAVPKPPALPEVALRTPSRRVHELSAATYQPWLVATAPHAGWDAHGYMQFPQEPQK